MEDIKKRIEYKLFQDIEQKKADEIAEAERGIFLLTFRV
jgi:hypothetical protein